MKARLARKIIGTVAIYGNWDSNYQPYSLELQKKAFRKMKAPEVVFKYGIFYKIPVKFRKRLNFRKRVPSNQRCTIYTLDL